jgi:putative acetyltransferase
MLVISQAESAAEIEAVRELMREFTTWAFSLQDWIADAPTFENLEQELASLPAGFAPPSGRLLLARQDGGPAGCIALLGHDAATCELKRLYVRPDYRGDGVGRALVGRLMQEARQAGYERIVLDSHASMTAAHALYEAFGFHRVEAPEDYPDDLKPHVVFMECELPRP